MKRYISLSGLAASGKSTIGKKLATRLKWDFVSIGNFSRDYAKENFNMNINEFQEYCSKHPKIDEKIDNYFIDYVSKKDNLVIDYRLAFHFIPEAFQVFLNVSEKEAVKRLINAGRIDEFKHQDYIFIRKKMNERNNLMRNRFIKQYHVDFLNHKNYDLIIKTDLYENFNEIVEIIINNYKKLN